MWDHKTEGAIVSDPQLDTTDVKKIRLKYARSCFGDRETGSIFE